MIIEYSACSFDIHIQTHFKQFWGNLTASRARLSFPQHSSQHWTSLPYASLPSDVKLLSLKLTHPAWDFWRNKRALANFSAYTSTSCFSEVGALFEGFLKLCSQAIALSKTQIKLFLKFIEIQCSFHWCCIILLLITPVTERFSRFLNLLYFFCIMPLLCSLHFFLR